ncbi:MAG: hypothetical protein ACKVQW_05185 [Pyrinomonadaceae bacterium]
MRKRQMVFRRITYRLLALAIVLVGIVAVRYYTVPHEARFVFYVDIPPPLETEIGDRDISQYEFGGHIADCSLIYWGQEDVQKGEECFRTREAARKFIEEHFKNQRRGYVIIDNVSLDLPRTAYFFIEPSEAGLQWEIRVRYRQEGPYTRFHRNMNTAYYTEAFRRRVSDGAFFIKNGTNALVLRSRRVYELPL